MIIKKTVQQLSSFILPVTVLIIVPFCIEKDISVKYLSAFIPGIAVMGLGLYAIVKTVLSMIRIGKGTLAPWSPSKHLVTSGMYAYVRNPMIMAVFTVLIGESTAILSFRILIWALCFFLLNNIFFMVYEEPSLEKKFGEEYLKYKKNVPRWIPRSHPFKPGQGAYNTH